MAVELSSENELLLYTLVGCHLCEQVEDMLRDMNIAWRPLEIDTDPDLEEKYAISIPVLQRTDNGQELFYPFNQQQVLEFLANCGSELARD